MSYRARRFPGRRSSGLLASGLPGCLLGGLLWLALSLPLARPAAAAPLIDGVVDAEYGPARATDPIGDYVGYAQWDLHLLHLTHDATHLYIAITIAGDLSVNPADEKNYLFYIDTTNDAAGATSDAWLRNISTAAPHRPEFSINTWYKTGAYGLANVELRSWTGSAWSTTPAQIAAAAMNTAGGRTVLEWKVARAALGNPSQLWVEAISTGSFQTDNAQDTLNVPANDWNAPSGATQWTAASTVQCSTPYVLVPPPDAGVPDARVPDLGQPDAGAPDLRRPDLGKPDAAKPDAAKPDAAKPDASRPDAHRPEQGQDQAPQPDKGMRDGAPPRDGSQRDQQGPPGDGTPWPGDGGRASDEGCGCAARGDLTAANALPLMLALLALGFHRRRR